MARGGSPGGAVVRRREGLEKLTTLAQIMHYYEPYELLDIVKLVGEWLQNPLDLTDGSFHRIFLKRQVEGLEERFFEVKMLSCYRMAERIGSAVFQGLNSGEATLDLRELAQELMRRIDDEVGTISFLSLTAEEKKRWSDRIPFGEDVFERFPSAIVDIEEASKCLALERPTAAVFHLMRAMEAALKVTAKALGIDYSPSWESYIKEIQSRIDTKYKQKGVRWRRDEPFFREVLGHLQAVKVAWRNPTMHIEKQYTPVQAEEVFNAVRGFMRHQASGLSEIAKGPTTRRLGPKVVD